MGNNTSCCSPLFPLFGYHIDAWFFATIRLLFQIAVWLDLGLSQHCREDNRILETMIVATIVAIVATIKKVAKLLILKAKFKEINQIIWKIQITKIHFRIVMPQIPLICALKTFLLVEYEITPFLLNFIRVFHCRYCRHCRNNKASIIVLLQQKLTRQYAQVYVWSPDHTQFYRALSSTFNIGSILHRIVVYFLTNESIDKLQQISKVRRFFLNNSWPANLINNQFSNEIYFRIYEKEIFDMSWFPAKNWEGHEKP